MKVKLLTSRAGVDFSQNVGDVVEVSGEEGKRMIENGQAVPLRNEAEPERAVSRGRKPKASDK